VNEKQKQIFYWLQQVSPELAELYKGAVKIIREDDFPGSGRFICHAVREIRNRLPETVAGKFDVEHLNYRDEVVGLAKAWENAGLGGVYEKQETTGEVEFSQRIPREVSIRIEQLLEKHKKVAYTNREKMRMLLVELEPENKTLQGSLSPVVDALFRETEWFVDRAHVGKEIDKSELFEHFQRYEQALYSLIGYFYEGMDDIERIAKTANEFVQPPNDKEVNEMILKLVRARYRMHFFDKLENPHWIIPLQKKGFFRSPEEPKAGEEYERWPEGWYLRKMASKVPTEVLHVIMKIKSKNPFVQNICLDCLLEMPENVASKGIGVIRNFLGERQYLGHFGWFWGGKQSAELMIKLIHKHPTKSLEIARLLLDIWRPGDKEAGIFERIRSKFATHEYKKLIFDYYSKVWEKRPFEAINVLIDVYDKYVDECFKEKNYDVSEYLGISLRDLDDIQRLDRDLNAIIMKAICEAGRAVIEKEPEKVNELLENLEKRNKGIFHRVEMYLLRFVAKETESDRINRIIANQKFIESPFYKFEHRHLLNDRFDEVNKETREKFIEWISQPKITEKKKEEVRQRCQNDNKELPDFEKWENQEKAEELYLVREKFNELYEEYKSKSGLTDDALAPRPMVSSKTEFVSSEEGSPYSSEKMEKDSVQSVINFLLELENYKGAEKVSGWGTAKDALASSFKANVKKRPIEYLSFDLKKLASLDHEFLEKLFYGVSETVRDGSFKKEGWEQLIDLACEIVRIKNKEREWKECFLAILWVLHDGFGEESNRITFNETIIRKLWLIYKELIRYNYDESLESEEDPFERRLRSVRGGSFGQIVSLGIVCKNDFSTLFEGFLRKEIEEVYKFVAEEVKRSEVNCTFGSDFARIYWLDKEWVESNLENIFGEELWDAVWVTYVSWGGPSPQCFKYLVEKGIYGKAVEKIGEKNRYKYGKEPKEGLVEHLMIGYFNGWIGFEDEVFKKFFKKASAELRGDAARFLTTGFKSVNEEGGKEKDEVAERMRTYWNGRLTAIKDKPKENEKEAIELAGWVEDSVLPAKETLELLEKTLDLSVGKIGELRDAKEFIEGICKLGQGNELLALRCLKKAAEDKNMHYTWSMIQEPLVKFLEALPEDARVEGKDVADLYGRYNPDKFRAVWEKLNVAMGSD